MIDACIGMNLFIALLSTIALIVVVRRRFEYFTFVCLLLFALASTVITAGQLLHTRCYLRFIREEDLMNYESGALVVSMLT